MLKYFAANPASKAVCWPMFLSTFSHYSLFHLFANMFVLNSFSSSAVDTLGQEQYIGMYMAAGVFASLTSYFYKFAISAPGYSLGTSGAIMCVIAYVCKSFPDTRVQVIFLPQINFTAENALLGVMLFDLVGVIFKWKLFDHAAHLGGACFGLFWTQCGHHIWPMREYIVGYYHQLRGKTR
jgi:rhomboid-like protein